MSSLGNRIDANSAFITGDDPGALTLTGQKTLSVFVPSGGGPRIGKPFNEIGTSKYNLVVTATREHEALAPSNPPPQYPAYLAPIPTTVQEERCRVRQTPLSFEVSNEIAQSGALLQAGGIADSTMFGGAWAQQQRNADEPQIDTNSFLSDDPAPAEEKVHQPVPTQVEVHPPVQPAPANPPRPTYAKEPTKNRRKEKRRKGIKRSKRTGTRKGARWTKQHSQRWYLSLGKRPGERIKYQCTVCDGVTAHPRNHFATHHEDNNPEVSQAAAAFRYACNQCSHTFAQKPALTKHKVKCHGRCAVPQINVGTSPPPKNGFGGVSPGCAAIRDVPLSHFTESVSSGSPMLSPALSSVSAASVPPLFSPSTSTSNARSISPAVSPNAVQLVQTSFSSGDQVMAIQQMDIGDTSPMSTMAFDNATCPLP